MARVNREDSASRSRSLETIVALSTAPGEGALAVVRLSGPNAVAIADRLFGGRRPLSQSEAWRAQLGVVRRSDGSIVDQVLATVMPGPRSYTGEDVVELSGHGGVLVSHLVIEAAIEAGARPALPGEFTRRAFQNGRLDLAQAEAVVDVIRARGERALRNALAQLGGGLSGRLSEIKDLILGELVPIEAFIDFGEDVPEPPEGRDLLPKLETIRACVDRLLAGDRRGRLLSEGATVVLAGKPNVGKSSLLNAMAGRDRAIVHHVPGTTRDTIEVSLAVGGVPLTLVDTAGIRTTPDPVEDVGVDRARRAVEAAQLVLLVVDGSAPPEEDDRLVAARLEGNDALVVRNKCDLGNDAASAAWCAGLDRPVHTVSAVTGSGIASLVDGISARMEAHLGSDEGVTMTRARHFDALRRTRAALDRAAAAAGSRAFADMIAADLREALQCLGEVSGESAGPEILDTIFSTFCIGK